MASSTVLQKTVVNKKYTTAFHWFHCAGCLYNFKDIFAAARYVLHLQQSVLNQVKNYVRSKSHIFDA